MSQSAPDVRSRRRTETATRATEFARQRTIDDGLASFTVEDVCAAADFSRRTFFNYFASKEDAVLGILQTRGDDDCDVAFVDAEGDVWDDLVTRQATLWVRNAVSIDDVTAIGAAIEREPKLLSRMFAHIHETERQTTRLIEEREGYEAGDPRAATIALLFGTLMRLAIEEVFTHPDGPPFEDVLRARVALARSLFSATESPA